jgi:hypothetical protein
MFGNLQAATRLRQATAALALVGAVAFGVLGCGSDSSTSSEPEQSNIAPTNSESAGGSEASIEEAKAQANAAVEEAKEKASQTVEEAKADASMSKGELQTIKAEAKEALIAAKEQAKSTLEAAKAGE